MISKEQIEYISGLARIKLTEEEKEKLVEDLSSVLDYIEKLNQVDTKSVKAIQQITGLESVMREDEIKSVGEIGKILEQAPAKKDNYFKAPKIME